MNDTWYKIENIDQLDSPALVVYPDRVKQNIRLLKSMIDDPSRLRPHIKTHKSKEATQLQIQEGINKFKCATIAEAEMLGMCGARNVLLAYQPVGPKLHRFLMLIAKYPSTKFSCLTDNENIAQHIADACGEKNIMLDIYIDLNIGMNRTGIAPGNAARQLYSFCANQKNIAPIGLHAYDGHLHQTDIQQRTAECDKAFALVDEFKKEISIEGLPEPIIVAGGSPTFPIHAKRKKIECSPGTFIYWDKGYIDICPEQSFVPAAVLITRVVSVPGATKVCLDLGHKSVAAENELSRRVYFLNAPELKATSQSEEHLIVDAGKKHAYKPGDAFYGLPFHICPTVALYEKVFTVENGQITGEWKTIARDRSIEA